MTNSQFEDFVNRTGYVTENEKFGWSFVFETLLAPKVLARVKNAVAGAGELNAWGYAWKGRVRSAIHCV